MARVLTLGEALIDFVPVQAGLKLQDVPGFQRAPGGAPANVAVGLCRLGVPAGFIGKLGNDAFGHFLHGVLAENGVEIEGLSYTPAAKTSLAFVSLTSTGERDFLFYRDPGADALLEESDINPEQVKRAEVFHHGSISLLSEPSRRATLRAAWLSRLHSLKVSFDPNLRPDLWKSREEALREIREALGGVDLLKLNREELHLISGFGDMDEGARWALERGAGLVVLTLGAGGSYFVNRAGEGRVPGWPVRAVDTTGAGDAFTAGMLAALLEGAGAGEDWASLPGETLTRACRFANAVAAISATRPGAIPSLPARQEVLSFLNKQGSQE